MTFLSSRIIRTVGGLPLGLALVLGLFLVFAARDASAAAPIPGGVAVELPNAQDVLRRVSERAQQVAKSGATNNYTYDKVSVTRETDGAGRLIKITEKRYQVRQSAGVPISKLVKIEGQDLTPKELEEQNSHEETLRHKVTGVDLHKKHLHRESVLPDEADFTNRFVLTVTNQVNIEGRPTLVMSIGHRAAAPVPKTLPDRIMDKVFGTLWVDGQDYEIARIEARLSEPIPLGWFGLVGTLKDFQVTADRRRQPDGVWVNTHNTFIFRLKTLVGARNYSITQRGSGFKKSLD